MSDTVEKLLNADPEKFKLSQEEREKLRQMIPEELEHQASAAGKSLGIDQGLLQEIRRIKAFQKSFGINSSYEPSDPSSKLSTVIKPDMVPTANSKAMDELFGRILDIQEKLAHSTDAGLKAINQSLQEQVDVAKSEAESAKQQAIAADKRARQANQLSLVSILIAIAAIAIPLLLAA